jgi:hypothetical protein
LPAPLPWTADSGSVTADSTSYEASGGLGAAYARVQAVARGWYNGIFRDVGDVFDIYSVNDFSPSNVSIVPPGNPNYPLYGWMLQVPSTTPLYSFALSNGGASTPVQGKYANNSQGVSNLSIYPYVV